MSIEKDMEKAIEKGVEKGIVKAVEKLIDKNLIAEVVENVTSAITPQLIATILVLKKLSLEKENISFETFNKYLDQIKSTADKDNNAPSV